MLKATKAISVIAGTVDLLAPLVNVSCDGFSIGTMRAAIYCRISDDREGAGLGVERQERDCRKQAKQLGWDVVDVYVDNDLSAFTKRKPRLSYLRMLEHVAAGHVEAIMAWHNDRLHRNARELEDFIDLVEQTGAAVQTVKAGKYDLTTPAGRMTARIIGSVAVYESETKQARQLRKALELAEAGKVGNGGPRPFGYARDRITIVEAEAEILREMYDRLTAGTGLRTLVRDLHERGITTTLGKPWSPQGLRLNLTSWRNIGIREHHGEGVAPAVWKPIIDRATWDTARAILTGPDRRGAGIVPTRKYLLSGFLFCGRCGHVLRPRRSSGTMRFGCPASTDGGCGGILVRYDPAEEHVRALLLARIERDANLTPDKPADRTAAYLASIAEDEQRLAALGEAFADDPDANPLELRAAGARIRKRIAQARIDLATQAAAIPVTPVIAEEFDSYDLDRRRATLAAVIERVDVMPATVPGRTTFEPERLQVTWR